jgi:CxxC motif-containing protein
MLPVRTDKAIPKRLLFKVIEQLADIELQAPVKMYDVILKNTAGTGANIVATRNMKHTATTRAVVQIDG